MVRGRAFEDRTAGQWNAGAKRNPSSSVLHHDRTDSLWRVAAALQVVPERPGRSRAPVLQPLLEHILGVRPEAARGPLADDGLGRVAAAHTGGHLRAGVALGGTRSRV